MCMYVYIAIPIYSIKDKTHGGRYILGSPHCPLVSYFPGATHFQRAGETQMGVGGQGTQDLGGYHSNRA